MCSHLDGSEARHHQQNDGGAPPDDGGYDGGYDERLAADGLLQLDRTDTETRDSSGDHGGGGDIEQPPETVCVVNGTLKAFWNTKTHIFTVYESNGKRPMRPSELTGSKLETLGGNAQRRNWKYSTKVMLENTEPKDFPSCNSYAKRIGISFTKYPEDHGQLPKEKKSGGDSIAQRRLAAAVGGGGSSRRRRAESEEEGLPAPKKHAATRSVDAHLIDLLNNVQGGDDVAVSDAFRAMDGAGIEDMMWLSVQAICHSHMSSAHTWYYFRAIREYVITGQLDRVAAFNKTLREVVFRR